MDLGLTDKVALITGGTSGIGLAIAQRLAEEGCRIAICGRERGKLDKAVATLKSTEPKGFVADVCKPADVDSTRHIFRHSASFEHEDGKLSHRRTRLLCEPG